MNISYEENKVILDDVEHFDIGKTMECGQAFNFEKIEDNYYKISAYRRVIFVKQKHKRVELYPTNKDEFENIWSHYFDLHTNYGEIYNKFVKDEVLKPLVEYGDGIRILKQDKWETLISFIISQNNRIPQIKKCIKYFSENFGDEIEGGFSFPTPEQLDKYSIEDIQLSKVGFRSKYIKDCTDKVIGGELDIYGIEQKSRDEIGKELMKIKGVGVKVANCVLLFAYSKADAFPIDVWIKRAMEVLYFDSVEQKTEDIQKFAEEKFEEYSGIVQQYIFYYARENELGK